MLLATGYISKEHDVKNNRPLPFIERRTEIKASLASGLDDKISKEPKNARFCWGRPEASAATPPNRVPIKDR